MPRRSKRPQRLATSTAVGFRFVIPSLAAITAIAALFGWGVAAGALNRVSLHHGLILENAADALLLSWAGIVIAVEKLPADSLWSIGLEVVRKGWGLPIVAALAVFAPMLFAKKFPGIANSLSKLKTKTAAISVSGLTLATITAVFVGVFVVIVQFLLPVILVTLLVLPTLIPFAGVILGTKYVEEHVILPTECFRPPEYAELVQSIRHPPQKQTGKSSDPVGAECVRAESLDPRKPFIACGRVVLGTPKLLILYNRYSGASRVPIADMLVSPSAVENGDTCRAAAVQQSIAPTHPPVALQAPPVSVRPDAQLITRARLPGKPKLRCARGVA